MKPAGMAVGKTGGLCGLLAVALMAVLFTALAPRNAHAQADVPFYADTEVEPNILFVLDVSGSMAWNFGTIDGQSRSRMDVIKRVLTGRYDGCANQANPDCVDKGDGVLDVFGALVNFALATYSGSPNTSGSTISFPNGGNATTFIKDDNSGLESTILALSPSGGTPTTQAMRDAGCWLVGPTAMDEALRTVATTKDPLLQPPNGGEQVTTTDFSGICPNNFNNPPLTPDIDPAFECRRTFIILATDGEETSGWGCSGGSGPYINSCRSSLQPERRKTIASALRRMPYLPAGDEKLGKIPTFVVLVAPCKEDPLPQIDEVEVVYAANVTTTYTITVDGVSCSWTGKTTSEYTVRNNLYNACNGVLPGVTVTKASSSRFLNLTANTPNLPFTATVSPAGSSGSRMDISTSQAPSDGKTGPNSCSDDNPLIQEGNTWAIYGGTDATPGPEGCLDMELGNGNNAYLGTDPDQLNLGMKLAIGCAIEGSHTRAEPTFVATSTNFAENLEIDGFFEIKVGEPWWRGHLKAFSFEQINNGDLANPIFDAGQLLTDRDAGNPRKLYSALRKPFSPQAVTPGDPRDGALITPVQEPTVVAPGDVVEFAKAYSPDLAIPVGVTSAEMDSLIEFIRDEDGLAQTVTFPTGTPKNWSLGAIVNSSPIIVRPPFFDFRVGQGEKYADYIRFHKEDPDTILVGAQDGFMHSFLLKDEFDKTKQSLGSELWGFMPYEALLRVPSMPTGVVFSVDGTPTVSTVRFYGKDATTEADDSFGNVVVFGLRGGGFSYVALDITDPLNPELLWQATHPSLGRTFSRPNIGEYEINWEGKTVQRRWMVAMGGGFNGTRSDGDPIPINPADCESFDNGQCLDQNGNVIDPPSGTLSGPDLGRPGVGNWILFYDIETGRFIQNVPIGDDPADPRYNSIPGNLLALDRDSNGSVDNIIVGDLEGRLWKILTFDPEPKNWWTDARAADAGLGDDPGLSPCIMFDQGSAADRVPFTQEELRRPIFLTPAATFDNTGFVHMVWGTGDLTDPNNAEAQDFLFAIVDPDAHSCGADDPKDAADLFKCDNIQDTSLKDAIAKAFPIALLPGEKILSTPLIIKGEFYVNTFLPGDAGCGSGQSRTFWGPIICSRLVPAPGQNTFDVVQVSAPGKTSPPLIVGPDGEPMTVRSVQDKEDVKKIGELATGRRLLHWVDVFGISCIMPGSTPEALQIQPGCNK